MIAPRPEDTEDVAAATPSTVAPQADQREQAIRNEERVKVLDWMHSDEAVSAVADRLRDLQARGISTTAPGQAITATRALGDALATLDQEGPCETCVGRKYVGSKKGNWFPERCPDCLDKEEEAPVGGCDRPRHFFYLFDRRVAKGVIEDDELISARRALPVPDQYETKEKDMNNDQAIGTITVTTEDIKEIEAGGCVTKETGDGVKVNVVFD